MICPHCQGENSEGKKFCKHCGQSLGIQQEVKNICPECHADNSLTSKFCKGCGASLVKEAIKIDVLKEQRTSPVQASGILTEPTQSKKMVPIVMISAAVVISIGSIAGVWYYKNQQALPPPTVSQPKEMPPVDMNIAMPEIEDKPFVKSELEIKYTTDTKNVPSDASALESTNTVTITPVSTTFSGSKNINDEEYRELKKISPAFTDADRRLNQAFSKLKNMLSASDREKLKQDQIRWIDKRNKQAYNAGSKGSKAYIQSLIEQSYQREQELWSAITKKAATQGDDSYLDNQMKQLKNFDQ